MVRYCKSYKCLNGKIAIVTGANTGIGYETALDFAKRGCRVILACRNEERANQARDKIIQETGNANIVVKILSLDSLKSVQDFAEDINATEDRLDILVNNAGAAYLPKQMTEDGLQIVMATNYFGPFLLTNLLLYLLKKSAPSRVINVSSYAAIFIKNLDLDKVNSHGNQNILYARSKLCNILFTQELAKRLEGTGVTTYSLHPGAVNTEFQRFSSLLQFMAKKWFITSEEGAQTTIYLSLQDGIEEHNGKHFHDSQPVKAYCAARDPDKAEKLWEMSEKLVGPKSKFKIPSNMLERDVDEDDTHL